MKDEGKEDEDEDEDDDDDGADEEDGGDACTLSCAVARGRRCASGDTVGASVHGVLHLEIAVATWRIRWTVERMFQILMNADVIGAMDSPVCVKQTNLNHVCWKIERARFYSTALNSHRRHQRCSYSMIVIPTLAQASCPIKSGVISKIDK